MIAPRFMVAILGIILAATILMVLFNSNVWMKSFIAIFTFRYLRLLVSLPAFATYCHESHSNTPPKHISSFTNDDVSVVICTRFRPDADEQDLLRDCVRRILDQNPHALILSVQVDRAGAAREFLDQCTSAAKSDVNTFVVSVPRLGKREQMIQALDKVSTAITIFSDDDSLWKPGLLNFLIGPFQDPEVGGSGIQMRAIRQQNPSVWNILGISYLERRNFNTGATNAIDGAISCLSGRTCAYRSSILKDHQFQHWFLNETYNGQRVTAGDDKSLTRHIFENGWKVKLQFDERFVLETTLHEGWAYVHQCLRWRRSSWNGNLQALWTCHFCYTTHPWSFYAIYVSSFIQFPAIFDPLLGWTLHRALINCGVDNRGRSLAMVVFVMWLIFSKQVKMIGHFRRHPTDMRFIPALLCFSYFHTIINLIAFLTLAENTWKAKPQVKEPDNSQRASKASTVSTLLPVHITSN